MCRREKGKYGKAQHWRTKPGSREPNILLSKFPPSLIYSILHRNSVSRKANNTKQSQKVPETDHIHWAPPSQRCQAARKRVRPESPAKGTRALSQWSSCLRAVQWLQVSSFQELSPRWGGPWLCNCL